MQIVKALRVITNRIITAVSGDPITTDVTVRYEGAYPLTDDLDLVYKSWLFANMPVEAFAKKGKVTISGSTDIDLTDPANDIDGDPIDRSWEACFGRFPSVACWFDPGSGDYELINLPVRKTTATTLQIDASGLTDVIVYLS